MESACPILALINIPGHTQMYTRKKIGVGRRGTTFPSVLGLLQPIAYCRDCASMIPPYGPIMERIVLLILLLQALEIFYHVYTGTTTFISLCWGYYILKNRRLGSVIQQQTLPKASCTQNWFLVPNVPHEPTRMKQKKNAVIKSCNFSLGFPFPYPSISKSAAFFRACLSSAVRSSCEVWMLTG